MIDFNEDACMRNSYNLLLGKKTLDDLIADKECNLTLMFNPEREYIKMQDDVYDVLIDYFISTEEYEKCAELVEAKAHVA
jgi:hypothetical protein|tara:strand:+ start:21332 stop:21571 length:240 start_codon:yes stop_codon:yes gene_type:complete